MATATAPGGTHVVCTGPDDGDLGREADPADLVRRRALVAPGEWTWLDQVHGSTVVVVERPGAGCGAAADAAVTRSPGAVLSVTTADCAGVAFWSDEGVVGVAHAGWRGLAAGVLQDCVAAMRELGARTIGWRLGPCISAAANEFSPDDLDALVERLGPAVRGRTSDGHPALDLRAGVGVALAEVGLDVPDGSLDVPCTVLDGPWFSWRARRDAARQATVVWMDPDRIDPDGAR